MMEPISCPSPHRDSRLVRLGHGSGGRMTAELIEEIFLPVLGNEILNQLDDAAIFACDSGQPLAITTDAYVVSPIFFPGGDIGSLACHGTINDLSMRGAQPKYMAASFIIEEGFPLEELKSVVQSFGNACSNALVKVVAADTKVVGRGAADGVFITTTGIGEVIWQPAPAAHRAVPGDLVLVSGDIGRHGMAVMSKREGLDFESTILSDSAPLFEQVRSLMQAGDRSTHCLRDITRGGLAGVVNELAQSSRTGIVLDETSIPVESQVGALCEILGLDPLFVACEGRFVAIVAEQSVERVLSALRQCPGAEGTAVIGRVVDSHPGRVVLQSKIGGERLLDKLSGEQLPRIC
ncbi:MAG TPA: hydrogenase expression/formation protein HypE [Chroococcales cyanobacterium]